MVTAPAEPDAPAWQATLSGEHKLITCILPGQVALPLMKALRAEKNVIADNVNNARGVGKLTRAVRRRLGDQTEKQILNVVIEAERAEEIFAFIYLKAGIGQPHGGLMFQTSLRRSIPFMLPDLPEEG